MAFEYNVLQINHFSRVDCNQSNLAKVIQRPSTCCLSEFDTCQRLTGPLIDITAKEVDWASGAWYGMAWHTATSRRSAIVMDTFSN